jgi:IclR family pca regulon transcriptional regulator
MHAAGDDGDLEPVTDHGLAPERSEPDERLFIASLEKGLRVLEAFSDATTELGLQDIAMATGLGKSAVQRLVYTLFQLDYLRRDPTTRKYRLSPKAFVRGYVLASTSKLAQEAHASLVVVNNKCGDTCALTILEGAEIVILSSILGRHIDSLNVTVGMRFPAHSVSSGRVLAAWLPREEARLVLGERLESLADDLAAIRRQGFYVAEDTNVPGHLSISAPVFDARGHAVATVNISTLKRRYPAVEMYQGLIELVVDAARDISMRLGHVSR